MDRRQRRMIGHGAIVALLGLGSGFGLLMSLIGGFEVWPNVLLEFTLVGDPGAWARAHAGGLMNGMLVMLIALVMNAMALPEAAQKTLFWMLVGTGYANTAFYWGGLLSPSRALTFGDNAYGESNIAGVLGLAPAFVFAFVTCLAMIILMRHAFSEAER